MQGRVTNLPLMKKPAEKECYHCYEWVPAGGRHNCWTTTEAALTADLPEDLLDAWERLRETAAGVSEQQLGAMMTTPQGSPRPPMDSLVSLRMENTVPCPKIVRGTRGQTH